MADITYRELMDVTEVGYRHCGDELYLAFPINGSYRQEGSPLNAFLRLARKVSISDLAREDSDFNEPALSGDFVDDLLAFAREWGPLGISNLCGRPKVHAGHWLDCLKHRETCYLRDEYVWHEADRVIIGFCSWELVDNWGYYLALFAWLTRLTIELRHNLPIDKSERESLRLFGGPPICEPLPEVAQQLQRAWFNVSSKPVFRTLNGRLEKIDPLPDVQLPNTEVSAEYLRYRVAEWLTRLLGPDYSYFQAHVLWDKSKGLLLETRSLLPRTGDDSSGESLFSRIANELVGSLIEDRTIACQECGFVFSLEKGEDGRAHRKSRKYCSVCQIEVHRRQRLENWNRNKDRYRPKGEANVSKARHPI